MLKPPKDIIISGLRDEPDDKTRLSLEEFSSIVQSHLTRIDEAEHSVQLVYVPFKEDCKIQPVQCRKAINSLEEMNERMQEFCKLLNETLRLPIVFTALRYRLLFVLHRVEEQISRLVDLIDSYRVIGVTTSQYAQRLHREIEDAFEALLLHVTDISQQVKFLDDEAKFQEQRLISILEGE